MNEALREAAAIDPEWAKREARRQFLLKATVAGTLLALAIGTVAFVLGFHNAERITHVEHSACQVDAGSYECQHTKLEAERAANLRTTCAPFFKAGYPCPKPGSTAAERQTRRKSQASSGSAQELNSGSRGGSTNSGSVRTAKPGNGEHVSSPAVPKQTPHSGSKGGATESPSPAPTTAPAAPNQSSGTGGPAQGTTETSPGGSTGSSAGLLPGVVEATGKAAGEVVGSATEGVNETLCTVRGLLSPCP